jgi:Domain of unknown function (DUF5666)
MRWKGFGIAAAALVAAAALPLTALGGTTTPEGGWFAGAVTSAGSGSVSLDVLWTGPHDTQLNGTTVAVGITPSTQIVYGKGQSSIAPGDLIGVRATGIKSTTLTAREIHVRCNCHFVAGKLGSVGGSSFAVNVSKTGPYDTVLKGNAVTFQVNGSTAVVQGGAKTPAAVSDLKTGEAVAVVFSATGFFKDPSFNWQTATFTATHVRYRSS